MPSRFVQRSAALGVLIAFAAGLGAAAWSWAGTYADGEREIADKRAQLRGLRDLAAARTGFERLTRKKTGALILLADNNPQEALTAAVNHAAEGQQIVVDGIEALPAEATLVSATVRLRGTQSGVYTFLRTIEDQTPYLVVPRLEIEPFRAADVEHGKPLILRADIRVAALAAPAVMPRPSTAPPP